MIAFGLSELHTKSQSPEDTGRKTNIMTYVPEFYFAVNMQANKYYLIWIRKTNCKTYPYNVYKLNH